jgi:hypothetical protein
MHEIIKKEIESTLTFPMADERYVNRLRKNNTGWDLIRDLLDYQNILLYQETCQLDREIVKKYNLDMVDYSMLGCIDKELQDEL